MRGTHLFILGLDLLKSISNEDVEATVEGLKTLDLYRLPYPKVSVRIPAQSACYPKGETPDMKYADWDEEAMVWRPKLGPAHWIQFENLSLDDEQIGCRIVCEGDKDWKPYNQVIGPEYMLSGTRLGVIDLLIALLATRNAVKTTKHNKLVALGIGGKKDCARRFEYVTTISTPTVMEDDHTVRPGAAKRPHLRRGHIRHQAYGPNRSYRRDRWIEPMFINADKDFVDARAAYNVSRRPT